MWTRQASGSSERRFSICECHGRADIPEFVGPADLAMEGRSAAGLSFEL